MIKDLDKYLKLTRMADEIATAYPENYHNRTDFQAIVDERAKLLTKESNHA